MFKRLAIKLLDRVNGAREAKITIAANNIFKICSTLFKLLTRLVDIHIISGQHVFSSKFSKRLILTFIDMM